MEQNADGGFTAERAGRIMDTLYEAMSHVNQAQQALKEAQELLAFELPENRQQVDHLVGALTVSNHAIITQANLWLSIKYAREY